MVRLAVAVEGGVDVVWVSHLHADIFACEYLLHAREDDGRVGLADCDGAKVPERDGA